MDRLRGLALALGRLMETIGLIAAALSGVILVSMVGLILFGIFMRNVVGSSLGFVGEFVGYGVAAITFNALAFTMQKNALIRVSLVVGLARAHPRLGWLLDFVTLVATLAAVSLAALYFWYSVLRHWARGTVSATRAEMPLWIPESLVLTGLALFGMQLVIATFNLLVGNKAYGSTGLMEQDETWGSRADRVEDRT